MAAGQCPRDPAHLPAELLVVFVSIGQVAIGEADHDHADGERSQDDDWQQQAGGCLLFRLDNWSSESSHVLR